MTQTAQSASTSAKVCPSNDGSRYRSFAATTSRRYLRYNLREITAPRPPNNGPETKRRSHVTAIRIVKSPRRRSWNRDSGAFRGTQHRQCVAVASTLVAVRWRPSVAVLPQVREKKTDRTGKTFRRRRRPPVPAVRSHVTGSCLDWSLNLNSRRNRLSPPILWIDDVISIQSQRGNAAENQRRLRRRRYQIQIPAHEQRSDHK